MFQLSLWTAFHCRTTRGAAIKKSCRCVSRRMIMLSRAKISGKKLKELYFVYCLANPAETAYLSVRDRELSNAVGLSISGEEKLQFTLFWGWSQAGLVRQRSCQNYRKPYLFCLRFYSGEISHSNSHHRELSNCISDVVVRRRKVALHTISHLTPTEA